ncbi:MAG: asparagine synthase-related protein [bacterium]
MKIIIGNDNKIEFSSIPLKKGTNFLGQVDGVVNPETLELTPVENVETLGDKVTPAQIYARGGIVSTNGQDQFSWASPDFSAFSDIFYVKLPDKKLLLGNNFFDVLSHLPFVTIDRKNIEYFLRLGYFPPGKTFFEEIPRIKIGNKLEIIDNRPTEKSIWELVKPNINYGYETFKKALSSVFSCEQVSDNDSIFLSSGCDSGLVTALIVKKFGKHPLAVTFHRIPSLRVNEIDSALTKNIANFLEIEHVLLDSDYNMENISYLDIFFKRMPLGAHLAGPYFQMAQEIQKRNIKKLWAGENSDYLYNLGPTAKTPSGKIRRFYFSKEYIKSLPDIKDKNSAGFIYRLIGEAGNLALKVKLGYNTRQPKDFQELVSAWENSPAFLALPLKNSNFKRKFFQPDLDSTEARKHMIEKMVQFMIAGRDGRAIHEAAKECDLKPILPYSATNMIHFFRGMETSLIDALKPKRFTYRYLEELIGKDNYERLYSSPRKDFLKKSEPYLNFRQYQSAIINETNFGSDLKAAVKNMISFNPIMDKFKELYNFDSLYCLPDLFWLGRTLQTAKNMGIEVKYSD